MLTSHSDSDGFHNRDLSPFLPFPGWGCFTSLYQSHLHGLFSISAAPESGIPHNLLRSSALDISIVHWLDFPAARRQYLACDYGKTTGGSCHPSPE
jgi:hypothetical protein